jgi:PAS domain S-box-containing protein
VKQENIHSIIELDELSSALINSLGTQVAILNGEGDVVACNNSWKTFYDEAEERWSHPYLGTSILKSLQAPLAEGNDFALRLLLGIKEVLNEETHSFETKIKLHTKWFKVTVKLLGTRQQALLIYEDITSQTENQKYLRETRAKFENHFHNSLYGILISDEKGVVIEANQVACNLLETSQEALLFSQVSKYIPIDADVNQLQKRINREGNIIGEVEFNSSNATKIPAELSATIFRNTDEKPIISWAFKDISEKKQTEQALQQSEKQYELQFNNTLEGIVIGRPNGLIITANPAFCKMLGYTAQELEGKQRDIFFDSENSFNKEVLKKRRQDGSFAGELEFTHKEGHKLLVEASSVIFDAEDGSEKTIVNIRDITKRKAMQQQLFEEKEFIESAISSLPTAFFVFTAKGEMIRWNDMLEEDLAYSAHEIARMNVLEFVHPEDRPKLKSILEGELVGKKVSIEARCISKFGKTIYYLISGTSFKQNGQTYIVGGGLNRNDIKEIESEKRKNAELLSQLFYNSPIAIARIDTKGIVQGTNKSFENVFGYKTCEIEGKFLDETIVPQSKDDEAHALSAQSFTGDSFQTESVRIDKDGKEVPVLIGGVPVEVDGEIISIFGMYVDISERKKLEDQVLELLEAEKKARIHLQDMFEEAPSAIAILEGEDHTITFANDKYKDLIGRRDILEKPIGQVLPEFSKQGFIDLLDTCYTEGKPFIFDETEVYFKKEDSEETSTHYLNFVYKPLHEDNGSVHGIYIQAIDVTEEVEAQKTIKSSLAEKETLLNEVHHRVKNNLAIISGLLELEIMSLDDTQLSKHLTSTQSRIKSIAKIHELLYQNESLSHVSFDKFLESMIDSNNISLGNPNIVSEFDLQEVILNVNQAIPAGILLNEVIDCLTEKIQEVGKKPSLSLSVSEQENLVRIEINDTSGSNTIENCKFIFDGEETSLRKELIDVLSKQVHAEITISNNGSSKLVISFEKRETKGSHNALNN